MKKNSNNSNDEIIFDGDFEGSRSLPDSFQRLLNGELTREEAVKERMKELGLD